MLLLALAIAPGLAICIYIFYRDVHDREPAINLIMSFFWGMLTTLPAIALELMSRQLRNQSVLGTMFTAFFLIALAEEFSKWLALRYYSFTRTSFDEPLDGIVYAIMVSMGFATVENIAYVFEYGFSTALVRIFTAVPAHASFGVIMGYYVGLAKFDPLRRRQLLLWSVITATLAHGFYDLFLFFTQSNWISSYISKPASDLLFFTSAFGVLIISVILSLRLVRLHRLTSRQLYLGKPVLTIRHASKNDIELIRSLALQVWPQTYAPILSPAQIRYMMNLMYSEKALGYQMEQNHQFIIVYNAGIPIGFAAYGETEPTIYKLHKIYILGKQQGRGTGRFVIEQVINDIMPKGATALLLNVNRNNKALSFYERLGFQVIRQEDIDIGGGYFMNDFIMEKRLRDPVEILGTST